VQSAFKCRVRSAAEGRSPKEQEQESPKDLPFGVERSGERGVGTLARTLPLKSSGEASARYWPEGLLFRVDQA